MRVVIDGLPIGHDDNLGRVVARLLQVWSHPRDTDELHLVVAGSPQIIIPDWVVVHQVKSGRRGRIGRLYARSVGIPRLCRSLKAQVLLGLRPTRPLTSIMCPRSTVRYDLWHQPGSEQFTGMALVEPDTGIAWSRFAGRLRLSMVDAIADQDWHARRFKLRPAILWSSPAVTATRAVAATPARRPPLAGRLVHPQWSLPSRRSFRVIAAVSTSTLALSAAAAASVDLVASHSFPVNSPHHVVTTPGVGPRSAVGSGSSAPSNVVPMPAPTTSSTTAPNTSTSTSSSPSGSALPLTSTTAIGAPTTSAGLSIPGLTLPAVTLPSVPSPSLPAPTVTCTTSPTTTSSPLSFLNLCDLNVGGLSVGSK